MIFSSDSEDVISPEEMDRSIVESLGNLSEIQKFHLTNRIRTNAELSSFIQNMMHLPEKRAPDGIRILQWCMPIMTARWKIF